MSLMRWEPLGELENLRNFMNRMFTDTFPRRFFDGRDASVVWTVPVDIDETDDKIIVRAEVPGIDKKEIKVNFSNKRLTIEGERKQEEREEGRRYLRMERSYGRFQRSFTVDVPVKEEEIRATYKDGVLEIVLPKAKPEEHKGIDIQIEQ